MTSRKRFEVDEVVSTLRNIPDDVSVCNDSRSEFNDLYTPELDADYSFNDESKQDISESVHSGAHLPNCSCKRPLF